MTRDLVLLVPDKDIEQTFLGLLARHQSLGIRPIEYKIFVYANRDPGCYHTGHELLALYATEYSNGLIVFDRAWDGAPSQDPNQLAADVEGRLQPVWQNRAKCVVIDPEIENWVWSDSPNVDVAMGWRNRTPALRQWLRDEGHWPAGTVKPPDPKVAFEKSLRAVRLPPSSSIFRKLATTVSLGRCVDPAFQRVLEILQGWFPPTALT